MKMLKRLLSLAWLTRSWRRRAKGKPTDFPSSLVDPEEFARLIGSGRVEDLRILAKKLSGQPNVHA
jgi:hypothetical protein